MSLNITVSRGYTATDSTPITVADFNAGFLPTVQISGSVGSSDLDAGAVNTTHVVPGAYFTANAAGTANAITVLLTPTVSALTAGLWFSFKASANNTGAVTLAVNGLTAKAIKKLADQDLEAGDIRSGAEVWVQYDGTQFQLLTDGAAPRKVYAVATGAANAYAITLADYTPAALADLTGRVLLFKTNAANTGACTLAVGSLAATAIKKLDGNDPGSGDLPSGKILAVVYDGSVFQLLSVVGTASLPNTGPGAGAIAYPTSITLDAQGRVTAASAGSAPNANGSLKAWATLDGSVSTSDVSTVSSDGTAETVEITAHGWSDGQLIWFTATTIGGTSALTPYYVEVATVNTVKLHTTLAGAIAHSASDLVNITSTGASVNTVRRWVSNPLLSSSGVDGIILTASGFGYLDFTTAQASGNYSVSLSTGFDNGTVSDAFQIFVDTTAAPSTAGFKFCANTGSGLAKRVFIQVFA